MTSRHLNIDSMMEKLEARQLPSEIEVTELTAKATEILNSEDNIRRVNTPISICGDIHGQFDDLLELFRIGGQVPDVSYLFLGDYVDRGYQGIETVLYLFCMKVKHPDRVTLIRGNHECRNTTRAYGFYDECLKKYGSLNVWRCVMDVFDHLNVAAVVSDQIFAVHGGLSPKIKNLQDIEQINRKQELPEKGPFSDLLWSDPESNPPPFLTFRRCPLGTIEPWSRMAIWRRSHLPIFTPKRSQAGGKSPPTGCRRLQVHVRR